MILAGGHSTIIVEANEQSAEFGLLVEMAAGPARVSQLACKCRDLTLAVIGPDIGGGMLCRSHISMRQTRLHLP